MKKIPWKLVIISAIGNILIAAGITTVRYAKWGIDPFTSMCTGFASMLHLNLGTWQSGFNLVLFASLVLLSKKNLKYVNIGAIFNMFLLGYVIQFFVDTSTGILNISVPEELNIALWMQVIVFVVGILIVGLGCSLYTTADMGTGAYDALSIFMAEKLPIPYAICRIITDATCLVTAYFVKGPLGIATVLFMFAFGPIIAFFTETISKPLIEKLK